MPKKSSNKDLAHYLSDDFNIRVNLALERISCFQPLVFFKLFYELVRLIENGKALLAIERLNSHGYTASINLFIVYFLCQRIYPTMPGVESPTRPPAFSLIENECARLERLTGCNQENIVLRESPFLDERVLAEVACDRLCSKVVEVYLSQGVKQSEREQFIELRARQTERERLDQTLIRDIQNCIATPETSKRNPEFTTNRQVLALYYMLKHLKMKNVNKTVQANFIEFLTGKNNKKIYDSVREVDDLIFLKGGNDAAYVREWFENLGLTEIVQDIDTMLSKKS